LALKNKQAVVKMEICSKATTKLEAFKTKLADMSLLFSKTTGNYKLPT